MKANVLVWIGVIIAEYSAAKTPCLTREQMERSKCSGNCDYFYPNVSVTYSGTTCQRWDTTSPRDHDVTAADLNGHNEHNFCRNPDKEDNGPWCYTTDTERGKWEYCFDQCVETPKPCMSKADMEKSKCRTGCDYFYPDVSFTVSGKACQPWKSSYPHKHPWKRLLRKSKNLCRNPDKSPKGPWCYTTDPNTMREYCFEECTEEAPCLSKTEIDRSGCSDNCDYFYEDLNVTLGGRTCQRWDTNSPQPHSVSKSDLNGDAEHNFCRNPDSEKKGPWCYTTDSKKRMEYCFDECPDTAPCLSKKQMKQSECKGTCDYFYPDVSVTLTGRTCQRWDSASPHSHSYSAADLNGNAGHNFCRNPNGEPGGPWCYTTQSTERWEYCFSDCAEMRLQKREERPNLLFRDGSRFRWKSPGFEKINFTDVTIENAQKPHCFILRNKSPRNFRRLKIVSRERIGHVTNIAGFTDYTFCSNLDPRTSHTFLLPDLPNKHFNVVIDGYWTDTGIYGHFTKAEKRKWTRSLVQLHYIVNRDDFKAELIKEFAEDDDASDYDGVVDKFRKAKHTLHAFIIVNGSAGLYGGDYIAINRYRFTPDDGPTYKKALNTLTHEIAHSLDYDEDYAYPIGDAAEKVSERYYDEGIFHELDPFFE